jgi:hypothetical protein
MIFLEKFLLMEIFLELVEMGINLDEGLDKTAYMFTYNICENRNTRKTITNILDFTKYKHGLIYLHRIFSL